MFYIRDLSGLFSPYAVGALQPRRTVEHISAAAPVGPGGDTSTTLDVIVDGALDKHPNHPGFSAYDRARGEDSPPRRKLFAHELMTASVKTLSADDSLRDAATMFRNRRFRHIPILKEHALVGLLSDRDLLRKAAEPYHQDVPTTHRWESAKISTLMVSPVLTATPDTEIREIARVMFEERVGCVPILELEGKLVGIITRSDILRSLIGDAPLEMWG